MPIDYSKYPANWKTEIRPAILSRANDCCEFCGVPNYSIIIRDKGKNTYRFICNEEHDMISSKVKFGGYTYSGALKKLGFTKIILTIAHLDHDKENHKIDLERLKALCQKCHLQYDMKKHIENRKKNKTNSDNQIKLNLE